MKLSIIFPVLNQHELARNAMECALKNLSGETDVELIVLDNGSEVQFPLDSAVVPFKVTRIAQSIGVYPTFWEGLKHSTGDVLAFFHTDLMVTEKNWDKRLLVSFLDEKLGLVGFIGSNEIDYNGGRGYGTTSNFQGIEFVSSSGIGDARKTWKGSPAEAHGKRDVGYSRAAVVDGCAMVFRRSVLEAIKQRENFPPHHFYDRLLSCEVRELGYEVGVLGIGCDHISGQTVNQEPAYQKMAQDWIDRNLQWKGLITTAPDQTIYLEAERQWLSEYRDNKKLVPVKV